MMSKLLKLEGVQDTNKMENSVDDILNVEDVVVTGVNNFEFKENNEASSSSSSSLNTLSSAENPLRNPVILQHLFQLCPASILTSCRLVCKQWYDESLLTWRTAFPLAITFTYKKEIFLDKGLSIELATTGRIRTPLEELLEFISKPENQCETKPYRNFQIHLCVSIFWIERFNPFWISIGSNLTTLQLFNCTFRTVEEFRHVIYKYCPILQNLQIILCAFHTRDVENGLEYKEPIYGGHPHLKSLHVKLRSQDYEVNHLPVSWIELFSHFYLLSSLRLECSHQLSESQFGDVVAAIRVIRKQGKNRLPLKRFQIQLNRRVCLSKDQFSMMKELRLPLKECSIVVHAEMDVDFWISLLKYNATSMNTITIRRRQMVKDLLQGLMVPPLFPQFPFGIHLPNLTKFELSGDLNESLDFLKYMPNLSELDVSGRPYHEATNAVSNTCKEELANVKMRRLMAFKLLNFVMSDEDIQQLSKWMPNINNLEIAVNDWQFGIVCQSWKNLRKLTVFAARPPRIEEIGKGNTGLESLNFPHGKIAPETICSLFMHMPSLQIVRDHDGPVIRSQLNISSYRQAVKDNAVEQWMAVNGQDLERRRM